MADKLARYQGKRNFLLTPEPADGGVSGERLQFVVQKHCASHLHYDFRLALDGVMKSWPLPKGPTLASQQKRVAVQVNDRPTATNTSTEARSVGKEWVSPCRARWTRERKR